MKKQESNSLLRDEGMKNPSSSVDQNNDWVKVLYEVILKILTLGFYHLERHRSNNGDPK